MSVTLCVKTFILGLQFVLELCLIFIFYLFSSPSLLIGSLNLHTTYDQCLCGELQVCPIRSKAAVAFLRPALFLKFILGTDDDFVIYNVFFLKFMFLIW